MTVPSRTPMSGRCPTIRRATRERVRHFAQNGRPSSIDLSHPSRVRSVGEGPPSRPRVRSPYQGRTKDA